MIRQYEALQALNRAPVIRARGDGAELLDAWFTEVGLFLTEEELCSIWGWYCTRRFREKWVVPTRKDTAMTALEQFVEAYYPTGKEA